MKYILSILLIGILTSGLRAQGTDLDSLIDSVFDTKPDGASTKAPEVVPDPQPVVGTCAGECVPYYLCNEEGKVVIDGSGIIDIRVDDEEPQECPSYLETCCDAEFVKPPPTPTDPIPPPVTDGPIPVPPDTTNKGGSLFEGCGIRNTDGIGFRITGGKENEAEYGEFPWMVAILREDVVLDSPLNIYECGGSLLAPNVVLTGAHCIFNKDVKKMFIRAGEWDTQTKLEQFPNQDSKIADVVIHENYNPKNLVNDVALLFLETPVTLSDNVQTICLPPPNTIFDAKTCFASGWGKNLFGKEGKYQVILKKIDLPVVPHGSCQSALRKTRLGRRFVLDKSFLCAGGIKGKDTCRGDGGSPLVCPIQGAATQYYQAGTVAWGIGCGEDGVPGIYGNIAYLRNWIDSKLAGRADPKYYTYKK